MCWLLIRARSNPKATSWQAGDIVEVRPDDFTGWGAQEGLPTFYRVQVTGVDAARVKALLERAQSHEEFDADTGGFKPVWDRVRDWRIPLASLPAAILDTLQTTGQLVVTRAQAVNFIRNHLNEAPTLD